MIVRSVANNPDLIYRMDLFNDAADTINWLRITGGHDGLINRINELVREKETPMVLDAKLFDFQEDSSTYVAEISELQLERTPGAFTLINCSGPFSTYSFKCVGVDRSGEDVAGWRYVGTRLGKQVKALIIND